MATFNRNPYTMGLRDIKLRRAGTTVALPAPKQLTTTFQVVSGMERGGGTIVDAQAYIEGVEAAFQAGGWPLEALPIILGLTPGSVTGSSPNQSQEIDVLAGDSLPYFEVIGRAFTGKGGDIHVYLPSAKIMSGFAFQMQDGANYTAPEIVLQVIPDPVTRRLARIKPHETATEPTFPDATSITLTNIDVANNMATATATAHGLSAGQVLTISGAAAGYVNGLKQIIYVPDVDTFTFMAIGADVLTLTGTATY